MSEAATRNRVVRQHWAEPGSRHDRIVRLTKFGLPIVILLLVAMLAIAPFDRQGDVSFILDKKQVDKAAERMRVETARYTGEDDRGQKFSITAERALQKISDEPVVDIERMAARLDLARGPLTIIADKARYDLDAHTVDVIGPVRVSGPDGYRLVTRNVRINLKARTLVSAAPVEGEMRLGRFAAGGLYADLGERLVRLGGGARLKIVQGAVN